MAYYCGHCQIKLDDPLAISCQPCADFNQEADELLHIQNRRSKLYLATISVLMILGFIYFKYQDRIQEAIGSEKTAAQYRQQAMVCVGKGDIPCGIRNWRKVLAKTEGDTGAIANLAILLAQEENFKEAIILFDSYIAKGGGAYDSFAWYARSLKSVGKTKDAISWYYNSLAISPQLADVTEELSELLISEHQDYEALSLLAGFTKSYETNRFKARIQSIQLKIGKKPADAKLALKLPAVNGHYFLPIILGNQTLPEIFLVDTGATKIVLGSNLLQKDKLSFRTKETTVELMTADGRVLSGKEHIVDSIAVGKNILEKIEVLSCEGCTNLFGQNGLAHFDMQTIRENGMDFLILNAR